MRGAQVGSVISGVKQSMLFRGLEVSFLVSERCKQAIKACRFTNSEFKVKAMFQIQHSQLPITLEMILFMRKESWKEDWYLWGKVADACVHLCCTLALDIGRRISNFTHQDGKSAEDHCIRTEHVIFKCMGQEVAAGQPLRRFLTRYQLRPEAVSSATLLFLTQKEKGKAICVGLSAMK
jgi:hypothetical protein